MSWKEQIQKKKVNNYRCPYCSDTLDLLNHRELSGILDYECRNLDECPTHILYNAIEDKWYRLEKREISEPEKIL